MENSEKPTMEKVTSTALPNSSPITKEQLKHLRANFYKQILKFDPADHIKRLNKKHDSGALRISKKDLYALFGEKSQDKEAYLTIYFIVHNKDLADLNNLPDKYDRYHNQLSVVLEANALGVVGARVTVGSICPPDTNCGDDQNK